MRQDIGVIVYANNECEALDNAESVLKILVSRSVFDGYPELLIPFLADSKEGKKTIKNKMRNTKREFIKNITELRAILKQYSNEYIFKNEHIKKDEFVFMPRYKALLVGQYDGPSVFLYTHESAGIRTPKTLKNALDKWRCHYKEYPQKNPYNDKKVWVVSAEVTC